jgi:hypothetical protein
MVYLLVVETDIAVIEAVGTPRVAGRDAALALSAADC